MSVRGLLVTESVRGDGGVLRNSEGKRYMFNYVPEVFRAQYAETEEEADRWYSDPDHNRRPPELLPRDEVARANNAEVKAGRGSPHGGVFLDIASRLPAEEILKRLPSMYHQFKELADVDITKEPMEVGPAQHYVMGGVEVDPDTGESCVPGLFAAGEVSGGMHGSNRLGGNSLSDLLVFGRRAGLGAAEYIGRLGAKLPVADEGEIEAAQAEALAPLQRPDGENPYAVHADVQETMSNLVGIIRTETEIKKALAELETLGVRADAVGGGRRQRLQPRLASGPGPAQHHADGQVRGVRGAGAPGEPGRAHPRRLPRHAARVAQGQPGLRARGRRDQRSPGSQCRRCATT